MRDQSLHRITGAVLLALFILCAAGLEAADVPGDAQISSFSGVVPKAGLTTLVGDTILGVWSGGVGALALGTDGDEVLMAWSNSGRGWTSLYVQRLDRTGRLVTPLPQRLESGGSPWSMLSSPNLRVVWAAGFYHIFFTQLVPGGQWELEVIRLTREAEVVDTRTLCPSSYIFDAMAAGDEIVVATENRMLRLGTDLRVIDDFAVPDAIHTIAASPRGPVLVSVRPPAVAARFPDGTSIRLGTITSSYSARIAWTGSEYVAAWSECPSMCTVWMARFDEGLHPIGEPLQIEKTPFLCEFCPDQIGVSPLGDGSVFIHWPGWGKRFRGGVALDVKPVLGAGIPIATAHGLLLTVDRQLRISVIPPPGPDAEKPLPLHAAVQSVAAETLLAVAASDTEVAVARKRVTADRTFAVATIFDRQGRALREVYLGNYRSIALATDGVDFYALGTVGSYFDTYFQRVVNGAPVTPLGSRFPDLLLWTGNGFVTVETEFNEFLYRETMRLRWVDRAGKKIRPCGSMPELPGDLERNAVAVSGRGEILIAYRGSILRYRDGCAGVLESQPISAPPRPAWQDGTWAALSTEGNELSLATAAAGAPFVRRAAPFASGIRDADIAPAGGRWVVIERKASSAPFGVVRAWALDSAGNALGSWVVTESGATPRIAPLGDDRVLAVDERQMIEPPFSGATRVFVTPLSFETVVRRRGVRQ